MYGLEEKKSLIVIAVTGGIAAYRTCELVRSLVKQEQTVQVIMTENATRFIGPVTFEGLTDREVFAGKWDEGMVHIRMKNMAKVFAVVPATANIIGKFASGIADELVSTTYMAALGSGCPVIVAPSMNPGMYASPAVQRNLNLLKGDGVTVVDPAEGAAVCGDEGRGKMAEIGKIEEIILKLSNV